jgi:hypothetical protein
LARSGDRVRLQHVRIGGKLYTTIDWVVLFGQVLAEADASYFRLDDTRSVIARAYYSIDHARLVHFCKVLKTGLASGPEDEPIILLRDWLVQNEKGRNALAVVRECYGKTQRALKAHLLGENLTKLYAVVAELFPLPEETN